MPSIHGRDKPPVAGRSGRVPADGRIGPPRGGQPPTAGRGGGPPLDGRGGEPPGKKRFLLRLDPGLYAALERWAADELRSVNAHMEYLLREAVRKAGRGPRG